MQIAITGSSGLIGTALTAHLLAAGHGVLPVVRRSAAAGEISWDPAAGRLDPADVSGLDAIVHLAGAGIGDHRWTDDYKQVVLDSRVQSTSLLARTLAELGSDGPQVLVSGSAVGFYGERGDEVLDESSAGGDGFLADVCRAWEDATGPAEQAGVRVSHIRTGIVLSGDGGALDWKMKTLFKLGLGGRFGSGKQWWSWISIDDEVRAIEHLLTSPLSGPVNLTAPNPVRNAEFAKALGRRAEPAVVPARPVVRTQAGARPRARRCAAVRRPTCAADRAPRRRFRVRTHRGRGGSSGGARTPTRRMTTDVTGDRPIVIVGAGLAGLACATTLHDAGRAVRVIEASDGVGGRVRTDRVDGFLLDRGFQVLLTAYPEAHRQLDLEALDLRRFDPGALVHLGSQHSVIADPFRSPSRLIESIRSPAASLTDKLRVALADDGACARITPRCSSAATTGPTIEVLRDAGFSQRTIDRFFSTAVRWHPARPDAHGIAPHVRRDLPDARRR